MASTSHAEGCETCEHLPPQHIAVLISGTGTNLQALIDATRATPPSLPYARISFVLSNRKAAAGLDRAKRVDVPTAVLALQPFLNANPGATRSTYDAALAKLLLEGDAGTGGIKPDLIVLAGFMHILSAACLDPLLAANVPIINLHPALPGAFDGVDAIARAHAAFERGEVDRTGVMVHEVVPEVDRGTPIVVREIPLRKGETLPELEARIHEVEHEIIVDAARTVLERRRHPHLHPHLNLAALR